MNGMTIIFIINHVSYMVIIPIIFILLKIFVEGGGGGETIV